MPVEKPILISFKFNFEGVPVIGIIKITKPYGVRHVENGLKCLPALLLTKINFFNCLKF